MASANVSLSATVKKGDDSMNSTSVAGRSEQYLDMKDYDLQIGRNIAYSDIASRQKSMCDRFLCGPGTVWKCRKGH